MSINHDDPEWEHAARCVAGKWAGSALGYDDALQAARFGAWQAAESYDAQAGRSLFSWCWQRAWFAVQDEQRSAAGVRRLRSKETGEMVEWRRSVDANPVGLDDDPRLDTVADDGIDDMIDVEALVTSLAATKRERILLTALALDHTKVDVARRLGVDPSRVSQMLGDIRQRAINLGVVTV